LQIPLGADHKTSAVREEEVYHFRRFAARGEGGSSDADIQRLSCE